MSKTLKVTTDNKISVIDIDYDDYRSFQKAIGGYFETVRTQRMYDYFGQPMMMLVDEEGLIKGLPMNPCGSWMYGADKHGNIIAGDFVLAVPTEYGDMLPPENLEELKVRLIRDFNLQEVTVDG